MNLIVPARENGTALITVVCRRSGCESRSADRYSSALGIHFVREALVPAEVLEGRDILGEHLLGAASVDAPHDPEPRTQVVSSDCGPGLQAVAEVIGCRPRARRDLREIGAPSRKDNQGNSRHGGRTSHMDLQSGDPHDADR